MLAAPADDPFSPEVVAVHSRGIERWLLQELALRLGTRAGGDGIAANIAFPFPGRLAVDVLARASGVEADTDPWRPERAVWPLLDVLVAHAAADWLGPLAAQLGDDAPPGRRMALARRLADLFDRYAVHRPAMVLAWHDGRDVDARGRPLGPRSWQAALWRRLRARIGVPSSAERLRDVLPRVRAAGDPALPSRIVLHGLTALPVSHLQVLAALSDRHDVHLHLLHPTPSAWTPPDATSPGELPRRARDGSGTGAANGLLAAWGRDVLELAHVVAVAGVPAVDVALPGAAAPATALGVLQSGIRENRPPSDPGTQLDLRTQVRADDRSVEVHACHGRRRQVEALRDVLLHTFAELPDVEPRDVLVLCPDIETFAPLLHAVLDTADDVGDAAIPDLRLRLADRALRRTNPLLRVVDDLLELSARPLGRSDLVELLRRPPVVARFHLRPEDVDTIATWLTDTRVRWGIDGDERALFDMPDILDNTFDAALDRLFLGLAMSDEPGAAAGTVVPHEAVDGTAAELLGVLAEVVARLRDVRVTLRTPAPVVAWADRIAQAAETLTAARGDDAWQQRELVAVLDDLARSAIDHDGHPSTQPIGLADVRVLLDDRLRGRPTRANHRTGDLTACTLVPMRAVPHEVVVLLGLDDDAFPRAPLPDGDDLVTDDPRVGDRDPRGEDRQLLLDAVLSARRRLVVLHSSHDERTGAPRPPATPVLELLEELRRQVRRDDGSEHDVRVQHPMAATDDRLYTTDPARALDPGRAPFSFDARAARGVPGGAATPRPRAPAPAASDVVDLDVLAAVVGDPLVQYAARRLGLRRRPLDVDAGDQFPLRADGLDRWLVRDAMAPALRHGRPPEHTVQRLRDAGLLPPARHGDDVLEEAVQWGRTAVAVVGDVDPAPRVVRIELDVGDDRTVTGRVGVQHGDELRRIDAATCKPKHLLGLWVRLLALTAQAPEVAWHARNVSPSRGDVVEHVLRVDDHAIGVRDAAGRAAHARAVLRRLVLLHDLALRDAPPLGSDGLDRIGFPEPRSPDGARLPERHEGDLLRVCHGVEDAAAWLALVPSADEVAAFDWPADGSRARQWAHLLGGELAPHLSTRAVPSDGTGR